MTTSNPGRTGSTTPSRTAETRVSADRRPTPETKPFYKTTEFVAYLVAVIGVFVASQVVDTTDGHADYFRADRAWFYVVLLTIGYMVSRGLAKAGSRNPYES
jgi:hypothetical protein